jgi:hypothetical protein
MHGSSDLQPKGYNIIKSMYENKLQLNCCLWQLQRRKYFIVYEVAY